MKNDSAQTAGNIPLDVKGMNIDLLAFPGHKGLLGPQGVGGLYISPGVSPLPLKEGGTGSDSRSLLQPQQSPDRYESGTLNTPGIAGLGAGVKFILQEGLVKIREKENVLVNRLLEGLQNIPGVVLYGPSPGRERTSVVSINIEGVDSMEAALMLEQAFNIAVRAGLHCAPDAHRLLGTLDKGTIRLSLSYLNTKKDIDGCLEALASIAGGGMMMVLPARYSRQIVFKGIGEEGQEKLGRSRVAVIGMGALGTVIANNLCRAGVGFMRLVDRDYVEISNLQRQAIYNEQDVGENLPKAVAAVEHLQKVNSEIILEPVVSDVNSGNIEKLIEGMDLVLDGTDNLETRFLINEACHKHRLPWIYGGAIMSHGMTMNIIPGETPCLRCIYSTLPAPGSHPTCSSAGVLSMITGVIGCLEAAEAMKILTGSPEARKNLFMMDVWENTAQYLEVRKSPDCPTCGQNRYDFLGSVKGSYTTSLCGRDSVQVIPAQTGEVDFSALAEKLRPLGSVKHNRFILNFAVGDLEISLFKDGRAIIKNVRDENMAKSVYSEYIGL